MRMASFQRIPSLGDINEWKDVTIYDCNEKLLPLSNLYPPRILVEPQYFLRGIKGSIKECFVRETVAEMLIKASKLLPDGYKFVVWDAWRPIEVQERLFNLYAEKLKNLYTDLNEKDLVELTQKYISLPSADEDNPSPHNTGGAVDLSIVDSLGNYLNMGTSFDDFSDKSNTRYYEQLTDEGKTLSDEDLVILNNRRHWT